MTLRLRVAALVAPTAFTASLWAAPQQSPPSSVPQTPVFRAGVDLVALDVTVVDRNGAPVKGLTADAFTVRIDGQPRAVRTLDYVEYGAGAGPTSSGAQSSNTDVGATRASQGGRVVVILFDDLSLKPGAAEGLTIAAERVLTTLDDDDLVGLTTASGQGPVVSPTRDRAAIIAGLRSKMLIGSNLDLAAPFFITVKEGIDVWEDRRDALASLVNRECQPPVDRSSCLEQVRIAARRVATWAFRRTEMQLDAMKQTIEAMARAPKPRVVIALSTGLALGANRSFTDELKPITQAAAGAEVQFYALVEAGEITDITMSGQPLVSGRFGLNDRPSATRTESDYLRSGIQTVATAAGGEAFNVIGQAERFFRRIYSETSGVYRLGVESGPIKADQRFLDIKVTTTRSGATVRAHRHALVPGGAATSEPIEQQLRDRLAQGGIAFGVPIALATAVRGGRDGAVRIAVYAQIPASTSGPLTAMFGLVDAKGAMVESGRRELSASTTGDYRVTFDAPVAAGGYRLRFVVADATGNIGAVQHDVNATLTRFDRVQLSDVILTSVGADGASRFLALDALPAGAVSLRAAVELYLDAPATAEGLTVRLALLRADTTAMVATRDIVPTGADGTLAAVATLPVATLEPAPYIVQVTILDHGQPVGTLMAPFRK
ncbi:MAG TPA: VWA domain-containing protein [Vicinamibacterales bacterium]|nr:VWA domain-containing protein [Vicinamibacterales bacterium]